MTLENFLRKSKKQGSIPLSYKEVTVGLNGTTKVDYESHLYTRAKANVAQLMNRLRGTQLQAPQSNGGQHADESLVSRLYGEEVVIHAAKGYHYGKLNGYDGKNFMLGSYHFDTRKLDTFEYALESFSSDGAVVPSEDFISISEVPLDVEED